MSVFLPQFPGTPFDDVIVMGEDKNCVVNNDGGNNKYIIYLSDERNFTHTIIDDSPTLGQIYLVKWITRGHRNSTSHCKEVAYDEETQTLVTFLRDRKGKHTNTGRIILKRTKPGNVNKMKLYLCDKDPSWESEGRECIRDYTLNSIKRKLGAPYGDRPVPNVPFQFNLDTRALKAEPIPGLCGDFIISFLHREEDLYRRDGLNMTVYSMHLPENSFITIADQYIDLLKHDKPHYVLLYKKAEKALVYKQYKGKKWRYSLVKVPQAKRIVFGTTGNYRLLLDLKHDGRPVVNIGSEYVALAFRSLDEYKFTKNYVNESSNPKQLVLGVPSKTPTETKWKIKFGEAKTYTGDYAENTLIVGDALWAHLSREENDMRIIFKPSERGENRWKITVKKGKQRIHRATIEGANILAYQEGLVRSNLYNLVNGEKKRFNLKKIWQEKMDELQNDIINEANTCR